MHVGILGGTGPAGRALAVRLADAGVDVAIGSRSEERASETAAALLDRWPGRDLSIRGVVNEAALGGDVVVVATPWDAAQAVAASVADRLAGKVVVSMANALTKVGDELQALVPARGSVAVGVAAAAPGALVSGAFHHLPARELGDLDHSLDADVLVCADAERARSVTADLVDRVPGLRALDAGSLSTAAAVEAFTAVLLNLNVRYRTRAGLRVTGIPPRAG